MRVGITGHRGLGKDVADQVRSALRAELRTIPVNGLTGVSCIADGPDAWFAQEVLDRGGRLEVVVPAAAYRDGLPAWHHPAYDVLLRRAAQVHHTGLESSDSSAHMAGSEIMVGLVDRLIAVWDGQPARGFGGTADVVAYAQRMGVPVRVLWPQGATRD
jgi:hypothetical protein